MPADSNLQKLTIVFKEEALEQLQKIARHFQLKDEGEVVKMGISLLQKIDSSCRTFKKKNSSK